MKSAAVEGVSEGGKVFGLVGWKGLVHGRRRRWTDSVGHEELNRGDKNQHEDTRDPTSS